MSRGDIPCNMAGCREPARYKVAAPWSDGQFSELKTYGHACPAHLRAIFRSAEERRATYRPASGESVDEIRIYRCENGWLDWQLQRVEELEESYRSWGTGPEGV